uniref:Uncharacterized protein n=1 Tax=Megaselia scalaris TaxID=36166 RepID=T1GSF4_MEGSC
MDQRGGAAKTSLHSSNDSGFANEPPPQPEIDYSDEETRVPIRNRREKHFKSVRPASSVASWTLNRQSHGNRAQRAPLNAMRQSTSFENVIESDDEFMRGNIKRTKSFWKFGKSSEILTVKSKTLPRKMTNGMTSTPTDDEENIYGMSTQNTPKSLKKPTMMQTIEIDIEDPSDAETIHSERNNKSHKQKLNNDTMSKMMVGQEIDVTTDDDEDTGTLKMSDVKNFFEENNKQTDNGPTKYLKRQEILKQYYSSDESVSSDPYDCIVIQDHAQKEEKIKVRKHQMSNQQPPMEFQTFRQSSGNTKSSQSSTMKMNNKKDENSPGTMLPRTKLLKSTNNNLTIEKNLKKRNKEDKIPEKDRKTYGP